MPIPILNHLDLRSASELQNAILHKTTTGSSSNVEGKVIYDTGTNTIQYYNGGSWISLTGSGGDGFKTITVTGQSDVVADAAEDTLNLVPTANEIEITTTPGTDTITFGLPNNVTITGNLTVNGTTTTVNSTTVTIDDPVFTLGGDTAPESDDNKDRGIEFRYHDGSAARLGFFGFDDSGGEFIFLTAATNSSEVFSGTAGNITVGTAKMTTLNIGGTNVTSTAAELNLLDGVSGLVQADFTKLAAVTSTAAELNKLDGFNGSATNLNAISEQSSVTNSSVAHGDGFIHFDAGDPNVIRTQGIHNLATLLAGTQASTGLSATNSVLTVQQASTSAKGKVQFATAAEVKTGTNTSKATTIGDIAARTQVFTLTASSMNSSASFAAVLTHSLGTTDVIVEVYDVSTFARVFPEILHADADGDSSTSKIQVVCSHQPANNLRVIVSSAAGAGASGSVAYGIN